MKTYIEIGKTTFETEITERNGKRVVTMNGEPCDVEYHEADTHGQIILIKDGKSYAISIEGDAENISVTLAGHRYDAFLEDERERAANIAAKAASKGGGLLKAVMPGVVVEILVEAGQEVSEGQPLLILEAMKMQNEIGAPGPGIVSQIHAAAGTAVSAGDKLVTLTAPPE